MGRAKQLWDELSSALERRDADAIVELYAHDAVWLEPQNPPHETNLLIQAYLKDWMEPRENLDITTKRVLESEDGSTVAVEYTISYTAAGRRWKDLPRSTWLEVGEGGNVVSYQRDYY